ncbi:4-hydroxybenzoate octaprenyltransferase [Candidatus Riesia pediculischaeffi]|uniref:4-hydroxybenzoate octaprenyltransferase n=1 Tax=Candidatus Riesia pediculischaeffi PTSU TaxID=1401651 RepID=A0A0C1S0X8_9ENTR|nr:4-hydroxybenzoate octaprenyltransferase [Candidatus Riesia pediculischaeffi]KIE64212.1 4-hydroxybenzoate polyprenyltransferase [Candidatus Riesia pediculischaeffi PTSU]
MSRMIIFLITKAKIYFRIARINNPIGFLLFLYPILWTFWLLTKGTPDLGILLIFIFGTFSVRSAGCTINDLLDKKFDGLVKRTKNRPFPKKEIKEKEALIIFFLFSSISVFLAFQLSYASIMLASVSMILTIVYPLVKRFNHFPQIVLGISTGLSIPMIFLEINNSFFCTECLNLFLVNIVWTVIYDTQYAMVDKKYDLKIGLKSTAIFFSNFNQRAICFLQILMIIMLIYLGFQKNLKSVYFLGLFLVVLVFIYQYKIICNHQPESYIKAFLSNGLVGCILFLGILLNYIDYNR